MLKKQNYQRHLTSKSYDHEDFGRLGAEEDGMPLEQMRDAPEVETSTYEQSILNKRMGRKRKAAQDDEVRSKSFSKCFLEQKMKKAEYIIYIVTNGIDVNIIIFR